MESSAYCELAPKLRICKILNGMWQVSGNHGPIDFDCAIDDMISYHNLGFTTWDLADIYGPAEDFIGEFHKRLLHKDPTQLDNIQSHTKFVPSPGPMTKELVERSISTSSSRMNVNIIDLVQFHWWDYSHNAYHDALVNLQTLQDDKKIRHIGLTNFDTDHLEIIKDWKINIISNQIQYSIIDQRPLVKMEKYCKNNNVGILAYGTLCGGFLSEKYLGAAEPSPDQLSTASLHKYKQMIDAWGSWSLFQELLCVCSDIAKKHNVTIPNVAIRYILNRPAVKGVIVGARLGVSEHRTINSKTFDFDLDSDDLDAISLVTSKAANLFSLIGDCGDEYR